MLTIPDHDPLAKALTAAIRSGDVPELERLLAKHPDAVSARIQDAKGGYRPLLHVATDWPGHFPNVAAIIRLLIASGADPSASGNGSRTEETPLHWAASSDDVEAIDALLDGGAELEAPGASIAGGSPMDCAVGYGQFNAARRLLDRGAQTKLWHAAALGLMSRVQAYFDSATPPTAKEITEAFWQACHGGQRATAEFLLEQGAELNWIPPWSPSSPLDMAGSSDPGRQPTPDLVEWLRSRGAKTADELRQGVR